MNERTWSPAHRPPPLDPKSMLIRSTLIQYGTVMRLDHMTMQMIDVPAGLNGVVAAETAIGAVNGDEGYFHYGEHDATTLARQRTFEDVWFLIRDGRLPTAAETTA